MRSYFIKTLPLAMIFAFSLTTFGQATESQKPAGNIIIRDNYSISSTCSAMFLSAKADAQGKPFLYIAAKDGGLKIYSIGTGQKLVAGFTIDSFHSLHVMNLSQADHYLFLALGNHFGSALQSPGMAIIDVKDPTHPLLKSFWQDGSKRGGAGIVEAVGNYAYLGAMKNGLIIFDISDKAKPERISNFIPSINFPDAHPDAKKYNARGMMIVRDLVYLCFDAGGIRIISVADKKNPAELGRYSNPEMNGKPRAYNNIIIDDSIAYVAVDYCGMEVLNIKDPANIKLVSWWNPWNCKAGPLKWFTSNGHCNEIVMDKTNHLVFLSSGKSDLQVADVADPAKPVFKPLYGGTSNNMGTWGVSLSGRNIYLTYICAVIPFYSNWTGVKALRYDVE